MLRFPNSRWPRSSRLKTALAALGMKLAFQQSTTDFAGMTGGRDLWISAAIHRTYIRVDEKGTEAAATGLTVVATAMPNEPPPTVFTADHPFLFLIRDNRSGAFSSSFA